MADNTTETPIDSTAYVSIGKGPCILQARGKVVINANASLPAANTGGVLLLETGQPLVIAAVMTTNTIYATAVKPANGVGKATVVFLPLT